jgi:hypothetical protein
LWIINENGLIIVKNSQYIYFQVSRRLAEETWVDQGKDGVMDMHEDRTKQKNGIYPVAAGAVADDSCADDDSVDNIKCKTLQTRMHVFNLLCLPYSECFNFHEILTHSYLLLILN